MAARSERTPLDRASVLAAGVALADAEGLGALSMRRLAAGLGVVPMALYKHVRDKDDLVAGMLDRVIEDYAPPPEGLDGPGRLRHRVREARAAVERHPWLRPAFEEAGSPSGVALAHLDAVVADLVSVGYSHDLVHYVLHALGPRVWGYSAEAFGGDRRAAAVRDDPPAGPAPDLDALGAAFPHVAAVTRDSLARHPAGCDERHELEFTLDLLLDAAARLHESGWESRPRG